MNGIVALLLTFVRSAFIYLLWRANPDWLAIMQSARDTSDAIRYPYGFLIALGILGATLMPHNLYLHSGALAKRARVLPSSARDTALRLARNDTALSLGIAMLINAAIMIVAASSLAGSQSSVNANAAIGKNLGVAAAVILPSLYMPQVKARLLPVCWQAGFYPQGFKPVWLGQIDAARSSPV